MDDKTKVTKEVWRERMNNLMNRRSFGTHDHTYSPSKITDYKSHFANCKLGESVLDVGCGDMFVKGYCPGKYQGIDPFPINDHVIKADIETYVPFSRFETIVAFQVLDGLYDLEKAISNMKRLCNRNIILMVRFGIPPDEFHTLEITESLLDELMGSGEKNYHTFCKTYREELSPKIFLIEYSRVN